MALGSLCHRLVQGKYASIKKYKKVFRGSSLTTTSVWGTMPVVTVIATGHFVCNIRYLCPRLFPFPAPLDALQGPQVSAAFESSLLTFVQSSSKPQMTELFASWLFQSILSCSAMKIRLSTFRWKSPSKT